MMYARFDNFYELRSSLVRRALDLSFLSIWRCLRRSARTLPAEARVLDFGAGRAPYRALFARARAYVTVDSGAPADFADLAGLPAEARFEVVLALEVFEHVERPGLVLDALKAKLVPHGELWMSVPFGARVHRVPEDYLRYTPAGLRQLFADHGWTVISLEARGNDLTTFCAKAIFLVARRLVGRLKAFVALLGLVFVVPPALLVGHASLIFRIGYADDPLGYFVRARPT